MGGLDLLGTVIKIAVVFGLLFGTLKLLARYQGGGRPVRVAGARRQPAASVVEVVDQVRVGRTASVVTVRLGHRHVALAVTESSITNLGDVEVDLTEVDDEPADPPPKLLNAALDVLRERTTRR